MKIMIQEQWKKKQNKTKTLNIPPAQFLINWWVAVPQDGVVIEQHAACGADDK